MTTCSNATTFSSLLHCLRTERLGRGPFTAAASLCAGRHSRPHPTVAVEARPSRQLPRPVPPNCAGTACTYPGPTSSCDSGHPPGRARPDPDGRHERMAVHPGAGAGRPVRRGVQRLMTGVQVIGEDNKLLAALVGRRRPRREFRTSRPCATSSAASRTRSTTASRRTPGARGARRRTGRAAAPRPERGTADRRSRPFARSTVGLWRRRGRTPVGCSGSCPYVRSFRLRSARRCPQRRSTGATVLPVAISAYGGDGTTQRHPRPEPLLAAGAALGGRFPARGPGRLRGRRAARGRHRHAARVCRRPWPDRRAPPGLPAAWSTS